MKNFTSNKNILLFILMFAGAQVFAQTEFIATWKTDNPGTSNATSIRIPTTGSGYNYDVSWENDGNWETGITGDATHNYGTAGTYTVAIRGEFPRIYFSNSGDKEKILSIEQWGDITWSSMNGAFMGCSNLVGNATDIPDLTEVSTMERMFYGASVFNQDIGNWDVSNVTNMSYIFTGAYLFNGDIENWDVSNVTNMKWMFRDAYAFNRDIGTWNVSNVTDMNIMFHSASLFNQDIGNWDVSNVTDMGYMFDGASAFNQDISTWNVDNVTEMGAMFYNASAFNQDISIWNVENVTGMSGMFSGASAFNQDIGNWDVSNVTSMFIMFQNASSFNQDLGSWNVSNVTSISDMFRGVTLSTANYDALLMGWSNLILQNGLRFNAGNSKYCEGEAARTNIVDSFGWFISDGGLAETGCELGLADAELNTIRLYPNPASHSIVIENQSAAQLQELAVYDVIGRVVKSIDLQNTTERTSVDVSNLDKATYFINITTDQGSIVKKLIKD